MLVAGVSLLTLVEHANMGGLGAVETGDNLIRGLGTILIVASHQKQGILFVARLQASDS